MFVELLHDYGIIEKDDKREGYYVPAEGIKAKRLFLFGDGLSIGNLKVLETKIIREVTKPNKTEFVSAILKVLPCIHHGVGDFHMQMHILAAIYSLYYPSFLQVCQAVLRMKRIWKNPLNCYQTSKDLCLLVYNTLSFIRIRH